jgi:hypothetical protein
VTLSPPQLRKVINLLSDPGSAGNAAGVLAAEAARRGLLVSDLIAETASLASSSSSPASAPRSSSSAAPCWQDVEPADDGHGPYVKRIDADQIGLVAAILAETDKAWCIQLPNGNEAWLAKSVCENHGERPRRTGDLGRAEMVGAQDWASAMKRPTEKDPRILLALGERLAVAKRTLSPEAYDAGSASCGTRPVRPRATSIPHSAMSAARNFRPFAGGLANESYPIVCCRSRNGRRAPEAGVDVISRTCDRRTSIGTVRPIRGVRVMV